MHYFPFSGGQDYYVNQLVKLSSSLGLEQIVVQPKKSNVDYPSFVLTLPRIPGLKFFMNGIDWLWFNIMVSLKKRLLIKQDIIVSHYPFHLQPISNLKNKIVVISHGVDWPDNPSTWFDRKKLELAKKSFLLSKKNVVIVANDTEFLRKIGIKIKPASNYYNEIKKNIWFIPNSVDISKFKMKKLVKREKIILVPRNIRKSRGIDLAIKSFLILSKIKEFSEYKLIIAGGPLSGDYYEKCLELSKKSKKILFIGNISQKKLKKLYMSAMLTLIPTRQYEGTSLSALESMACKTPVVSTSIGGLKDLPTYKSGKSPSSMAESIKSVIERRSYYSKKQHAIVLKIFNEKIWQKTWSKIIK